MTVDRAQAAAPSPAARSVRSAPAIVEDAAEPAAGQERRTAFLTALRGDLERMVGEEFTDTPFAGAGCPLIDFYLEHFRAAPLEALRAAAVRVAPPAGDRADAAALRDGVVTAARAAVREWRRTGSLPPLPDELPQPPPPLARWLGLGGARPGGGSGQPPGVRRKAAGGPGRGTPPGGALARLGTGQPLPATLRSRMERSVGTSLDDVRVHTDTRAAALAGDEQAHALTVGAHIAFAAGAWRPGTPAGDALLAHEAAHVAQQRGSGTAVAGDEEAADAAAAGFLTGRPRRPPAAGGTGAGAGLRLQRCGDGTATFDWRGAAREEVGDAVARIRELQEELDRIAAGEMTPATEARLQEIQQELADEVQRLRAAGIRLDLVAILQAAQAGTDILRVTGRILGTEPARLHFGERRLLRLALDWVPQHTDVRTAWISELDAPVEKPEQPPAGRAGTAFEKPLNDVFWGSYEKGALQNQAAGGTKLPKVRVWVTVFAGSNRTPEARLATPWFEVTEEVPETTTIDSPRILTADPQLVASTEGAPEAPAAATPDVALALQGARIPFVLSWVPPIGWSTGRGYRVAWAVSGADATLSRAQLEALGRKGEGGRLPDSQQTVYEHKFGSTGEYVVYVVLQPGTTKVGETLTEGIGNLPTKVKYATHRAGAGDIVVGARRIKVLSTQAMATEQLDRTTRKPQRSFATFMGDLSGQITATGEAIEGGTLAPAELGAQQKRLTEQRDAIEKEFGRSDAMLPLPEKDADLRKDTVYVSPLPSAYAHRDIGGAQPLSTFFKLRWNGTQWEAVLVDATTSEILPRTGTADAPPQALLGALADWEARNDFPTGGHVMYRFARWGIDDGFDTTTTAKTLREWAQTILSVVGLIVGIILLLLPSPDPLTKGGGLALVKGVLGGVAITAMVGGILLGSYEIYRNLSLGRPLLSERNAIEALGILSSVLGVRGTLALRSAGGALQTGTAGAGTLRQIKMGERLVYTSAAIDVGTFVEVSASALAQLQAIANDESIPESEREQMLIRAIGMLAVQGLLLVGSNRDLFGRMVGGRRQAGVIEQRIAEGTPVELDLTNRALLQIELRNLGLEPVDLAGLDDAGLIRLLGEVHAAHAARPESGALGSAYGYGITPLQPAALSLTHFKKAVSAGILLPKDTTYAYDWNAGTATMTVTPSGGGTPHAVEIIFLRYPRGGVATPAAPHDRPGRARLAVKEVSPGKYSATVYLHEKLSRDDTRLLANAELREIAEIVHGYAASGGTDFAAHKAAQEQPAIFHKQTAATAATTATAEDKSSAHLLRQLWLASGFDAMPTADIPIDPTRERLDRLLSELGFGRVANHGELVKALSGVLGTEAPPKLIEYVWQYRWRRSAGARLAHYRQHAFARVAADATLGSPTTTLISQQLIEHIVVPQPRGATGIYGGHLDPALRDFEATHPDYVLTVATTGATGEGIPWTRYTYTYKGTQVMIGTRPAMKTTVEDIQGLLEMLERTVLLRRGTWSAWPAGHRSFGVGMNHPPLVSASGTRIGGALVITKDSSGAVTGVEIVSGWID